MYCHNFVFTILFLQDCENSAQSWAIVLSALALSRLGFLKVGSQEHQFLVPPLGFLEYLSALFLPVTPFLRGGAIKLRGSAV